MTYDFSQHEEKIHNISILLADLLQNLKAIVSTVALRITTTQDGGTIKIRHPRRSQGGQG